MRDETTDDFPEPHGVARLRLGATILDVGLSGVAFESETRLSPELEMTVCFGGAGDPIALEGRVVWCFFHGTEPAPTGEQRPVYRSGVEFIDVLTPPAQRLVGFLEAQSAPGGDSRRFGRFRLAPAEPVRVQTDCPFRCSEVEAETITVEMSLGFEPTPGLAVELTPRGGNAGIAGRIVAATRTDSPERWRATVAVPGADPGALATLRAVISD